MQVSVKINADTPVGRRLIKQLKNYPQDVIFDNSTVSESTPEGYVTLEEFRTEAKNRARKLLNSNGIY